MGKNSKDSNLDDLKRPYGLLNRYGYAAPPGTTPRQAYGMLKAVERDNPGMVKERNEWVKKNKNEYMARRILAKGQKKAAKGAQITVQNGAKKTAGNYLNSRALLPENGKKAAKKPVQKATGKSKQMSMFD